MDAVAHPSIVVVDSDEDTLELLGEYFMARGWQVHTAYAPEDAIALVQNIPVEAVFVDISAGAVALDLVRVARSRARPAAVVATTLGDDVKRVIEAMKAGTSDILCKPYRLRDLYGALEAAMVRRQHALDQQLARERLLFYEAAAQLLEPSGVSRVYGLLARVAQGTCSADEVAVWCPTDAGWSAVARGGRASVLDGVDPSELLELGESRYERVTTVPLRDGRAVLRAVLAVVTRSPLADHERSHLSLLARVVVDALERVEG